ncbi:MAG TPA: hypothetical protein VMS86_11200 [Thermoanaerobaculia bacterium]|nr:hypothetical protein [Thermoanaerobaculia bacterium]
MDGSATLRRDAGRESGLTLLEILVAGTVLMVAGSVGMPAFFNYMHRAKLEGAARETVMMLHASRLEAITRGRPAVVAVEEGSGELVAFADLDGENTGDPPDGIFNPVSGKGPRETDYELGRLRLPSGVMLLDPAGNEGVDAVDGFANPVPLQSKVAFFRIDGSAAGDGAFRLADRRGNFVEARIAAASTARVELRKWDGSVWREQGEGGSAWTWR